jgi:pimeloyl-ACP methyl ester carboxylesterase
MKKIFQILGIYILTILSACGPGDSGPASTPQTPSADVKGIHCDVRPLMANELTYCYDPRAALNSDGTVIYYLHGKGGSAQELFREPMREVVKAVSKSRFPLFIGLSLGTSEIIKLSNSGEIIRALERLERRILKNGAKRRHLIGLSMGGYNSLRLAAEQPGLFKSISLLCPALLNINPYLKSDLEDYSRRHSKYLDQGLLNKLLALLYREFPTEAHWRNNDPFRFLKLGRYRRLEHFISTGRQDSLGFAESSAEWVNQAQKQGLRIEWQPVDGSHCTFNDRQLAQFLEQKY